VRPEKVLEMGGCTGLIGRLITERGPCGEPIVKDPLGGDPFWPKCAKHLAWYRCVVCLEVLPEPERPWAFSSLLGCPTCHTQMDRVRDCSWWCPTCDHAVSDPVGLCYEHEAPARCGAAGCRLPAKPGRVSLLDPTRDPDGELCGFVSREVVRLCVEHDELESRKQRKLHREWARVQKDRESWTVSDWAAYREGRGKPDDQAAQGSLL